MIAPALTPKARLIAFAKELGFDSCRIGKATAPQHAEESRAWLAEGAAGDMQWMERGAEKRCDPQQVLPGARSIAVVALNYWQGGAAATIKSRVAGYA